ncbi:hypothetical protein M011DRAFT_451756 [Sporormia fimetaria CBS 119925]|uniref:Utp8 beta-propeller domain-containing protein n=1 Tax=Sporormia fimetaria CBS 119925 TaxID=1340428 RepID=A0A6A6UZR1_9PLEO|nr:hypothetical protein M011DRAFT_451756 [Sporormia fimetaria CBS 119925]
MSSETQMGAPFTLASLPRPGSTTAGRTLAAGVHSIGGSRKRKRAEVAVSVDGEGIFIYSLQNPQLLTSYALPPQTSFATPSYSLYRKSSKHSSVRTTYAATTEPGAGGKKQVICFVEEGRKDGTSDTTKTDYTLPNSGDEIVSLESIPQYGDADKTGSHDLLIVLASGRVLCLSSDLQTLRWESELAVADQERGKIEYFALTTAKAATGGLLRGRQDIAAILNPSLDENSELLAITPVIGAIIQLPNGRRVLSLSHIQPRSADLISARTQPMKHLITWDIPAPPESEELDTAQGRYYLHASSGVLHQLAGTRLLSYDFTGTVPKLYSNLKVPSANVSSFLRIAPQLLLVSTDQSVSIYDVKYASLQSSRTFGETTAQDTESKKRKHPDQDSSSKPNSIPNLVAYFTESGLAVALSDQQLLGIQLADGVARKRLRGNDTLLIDAVAKGVVRHTKQTAHKQDWETRIPKLDKYALKGRVGDFEKTFAGYLGIEVSPSRTTKTNEPLPNGTTPLTNVTVEEASEDEGLQQWNLTQAPSDSQRLRFRHCAIYALRKIFQSVPSQASQAHLRIEFFPPNVFQWLLQSGFVTKETIYHALSEDAVTAMPPIADGEIVNALVQYDPELHLLSAVLNYTHFLPVGEVVQAVRVLIQSLDDQSTDEDSPKLLTNGVEPPTNDMDVEMDSELDAATQDVDRALSMLKDGLAIRSHSLRPALIRLHTFPAPVIASTLRSMLHRRELESLIRLLHGELRNGGWSSSYNFLDPEEDRPEDQAVAIIASLLGCALDAIGAGAFLTSLSASTSASEDSSEDLIEDLVHDTSEALNGFWEASFIRGLLSEFLRYAGNFEKSNKPSTETLQKQGKPFAADLAAGDALPMLPLGGKVDLGVERKKPGKGGRKEERSKREMGMLISKRVPKYSLERVVV